jgi:CheY-like chemotaxis protein
MEAFGLLAGGLAHDFTNLMTGIVGNAYRLHSDPELCAKANEPLGVIIQSGERAAKLANELLKFARRGRPQNVPVDLHVTIEEIAGLLQRTLDKRIRVSARLRAARTHVLGDPNQLYHLLLNLCLNARDAMPEGGDLRICTKLSGSSLVISVQDSGSGIDSSVREHIFEPFFTTKTAEKAMGMGLAMVSGIAKVHGGTVSVESQPGNGSTFYVTLPLCGDYTASGSSTDGVESRRSTILVIDDEELVRQVLGRMLMGLGYNVVTAGDSEQALAYYRDFHDDVDLVIFDMAMGRMSGKVCFSALREANPKIRAVVSGRYSEESSIQKMIELGCVEFLQKPYHLRQLSAVISRALSRGAAQNA